MGDEQSPWTKVFFSIFQGYDECLTKFDVVLQNDHMIEVSCQINHYDFIDRDLDYDEYHFEHLTQSLITTLRQTMKQQLALHKSVISKGKIRMCRHLTRDSLLPEQTWDYVLQKETGSFLVCHSFLEN